MMTALQLYQKHCNGPFKLLLSVTPCTLHSSTLKHTLPSPSPYHLVVVLSPYYLAPPLPPAQPMLLPLVLPGPATIPTIKQPNFRL